MRHLSVSVIVVASACMVSAAVHAADLPIGGPGPFAVSEFVSTWYLRGDIGYEFSASRPNTDPPFFNSSYSDVPVIDAGLGYRAGWLRADVTMSWNFLPHFAGDTSFAQPDVTARIEALSTLVNVYVDLGSWYGLTPYIGAGAGFSWLLPTNFNSVSIPPSAASNSSTVDFAWDVTAGFSYAVTRQFLVDTSYRYLHVGTPRTTLEKIGPLDFGSMDFHELKTGIRYLID